MNMRRGVVTGALCAIAAGCGAANPASQLSPSSVTAGASSVSSGAAPQFSQQSIGSCPDGNAPSWLQTWTKGSTARLRWTEVAPTIEYHVVVEHYDVTNKYMPVNDGNFVVANQTWTELTLSEGRYRAKIQTRACGRFMGPWSEELQFSVEGNESTPTEAPGSSGESAEGTSASFGQTLKDSFGATWSFGVEDLPGIHEVLRNGISSGAWGSKLKYHDHAVYDLAVDGHWYLWTGSQWQDVGTTEP